MGKVVLIKSVRGLSESRKELLATRGIHRLSDLSSRTVAQVWRLVVSEKEEFAHLVIAMKAGKVSFQDCDPRKVDFLVDDLDSLKLSVPTYNRLNRVGMRSTELMYRIGARLLSEEVRLIGPQIIKELRTAFKDNWPGTARLRRDHAHC